MKVTKIAGKDYAAQADVTSIRLEITATTIALPITIPGRLRTFWSIDFPGVGVGVLLKLRFGASVWKG